jgi:hypothetical protein
MSPTTFDTRLSPVHGAPAGASCSRLAASTLRIACCVLGALFAAATLHAAETDGANLKPPRNPRFFDPDDGWLDVSGFLDTAYGFIPLAAPITEPAVGYGAVGALVFVDRDVAGQGQRYTRPNIAVVGGLATENGTRGLFAAHLGTWKEGKLRTLVGVADADVNLDFFGLGGDRRPESAPLGYSVSARGGVAGANYRRASPPGGSGCAMPWPRPASPSTRRASSRAISACAWAR